MMMNTAQNACGQSTAKPVDFVGNSTSDTPIQIAADLSSISLPAYCNCDHGSFPTRSYPGGAKLEPLNANMRLCLFFRFGSPDLKCIICGRLLVAAFGSAVVKFQLWTD